MKQAETSSFENCTLGCPSTWLSRMSASGWGADMFHLNLEVRYIIISIGLTFMKSNYILHYPVNMLLSHS